MKGKLSINERVWAALSPVEPKSVSLLMEETGVGYETMVEHLRQVGAIKLEAQRVPARYLRPATEDTVELVKRWRSERNKVAALVSTLTIAEGADPVWLADTFLDLGRKLTEIGMSIDRVKMNPDWHQQLGGHFWLSERKEDWQ